MVNNGSRRNVFALITDRARRSIQRLFTTLAHGITVDSAGEGSVDCPINGNLDHRVDRIAKMELILMNDTNTTFPSTILDTTSKGIDGSQRKINGP